MDSVEAELTSNTPFLQTPASEHSGPSWALGASAVTRLGEGNPGSRLCEAGGCIFLFPNCFHLAVGLGFFPGRCWCWPYPNCASQWGQSPCHRKNSRGIIEGNIARDILHSGLVCLVSFMTSDFLRAKTKISFKWLDSLKIGFEEDDLLGHWLRTSLKRLSCADTLRLVQVRNSPGWAELPLRCCIVSWVSEILNLSLFLEEKILLYLFIFNYSGLGLQVWNEQWVSKGIYNKQIHIILCIFKCLLSSDHGKWLNENGGIFFFVKVLKILKLGLFCIFRSMLRFHLIGGKNSDRCFK